MPAITVRIFVTPRGEPEMEVNGHGCSTMESTARYVELLDSIDIDYRIEITPCKE